MKHLVLIVLLIFLFTGLCTAQAVFQNIGSGNWSSTASWVLVSGSSSTGYPVAGDTATITGGGSITIDVNSQCNQLTINGGSALILNSVSSVLTVSNGLSVSAASTIDLTLGALTITGSMSLGSASTVTVTQGALTVVGLMTLTYPTAGAGTTLLDIEGGAFSCAGVMTVTATTVPAGRFAELRIGNGVVNLAGGVVTTSANARINFTGPGSLTLAGTVSINNANSFIAGTGRVIYFGIPGTNQAVAPLAYYRLVITGLGTGVKQIAGAATVTDTLTLLTDTLEVNSGGSLTLSNGITLVRTGGSLLSAPIFQGVADIIYNDIQRDTTGLEMPTAASVLRNLTVSDIAGIKLGANVTVNNNLNLQQGPLLTDVYSLVIANPSGGSGVDPAVSRTNGYVAGAITRSIGTTAGLRIFPLGAGSLQAYREFDLDYTTAPTVAGSLTVQDVDSSAPDQSGLPLADNSETIVNIAPMYWQADASGGLSGGVYTVTLTAGGAPGVSDLSTLRVVKRPSGGGPWAIDGMAGTNSGTKSAPIIVRTGLSGFSQFSFGSDNSNTLPITLLSFTGTATGNSVLLYWTTSSENGNLFFTVEHSLTGNSFEDIGQLTGAGTTTLEQSYHFNETDVPAGANYYRLKQTDARGSYTYSPVIVCMVAGVNPFKVFPNPATTQLTIQPGAGGVVILYSQNGQYCRLLSAGVNDISRLPAGFYYVKSGDNVLTVVKQ